MKKALLFIFCILLMGSVALAQGIPTGGVPGTQVQPLGDSNCGSGDPVLSTDGYFVKDTVQSQSSNFYFIHLKPGHSYAAEVWDGVDSNNTVTASLHVWAFPCSTTLPVTDVVSMDPDLSSMYADRISWVQSADALEVLEMRSAANSTQTYEIRIVDTTLFSPRWSTWSGFLTQWGFNNVTTSSISGVFTVFDTTGTAIKTVNITVPAGKVKLYSSVAGDLNLPVNTSGTVTFSYIGAPGAIQGDAAIMNSTVTVLFPAKFEPRNFQH